MRFVSGQDSSNAKLMNHAGSLGSQKANQSGAGDRLERHDDDPEIPIHPAGQKAGQLAEHAAGRSKARRAYS
jgi:hypothetical protein